MPEPVNLDAPSPANVREAMDVLKRAGVPQTTANIRIALEELHRAWRLEADARGRGTVP